VTCILLWSSNRGNSRIARAACHPTSAIGAHPFQSEALPQENKRQSLKRAEGPVYPFRRIELSVFASAVFIGRGDAPWLR